MKFSEIKYTAYESWFSMWLVDKKSILETMTKNMAADLNAGYDFHGVSIQTQVAEINAYKARFDADMDKISVMDDESKVERFCYMQLIKSGAIE